MPIDDEHLRQIFTVIHQSCASKDEFIEKTSIQKKPLSLDVLKKFIFSIEGKDNFRNIMRKIKRQRLVQKNEYENNRQYIPLTFEAMLNYLYEQTERKKTMESINYNQKSYLIDNSYHTLRPNKKVNSNCVKDLTLMTQLMRHDLNKSGELHSDSNAFYLGIS